MRRFLALGDSYTIGEGVDAAARWPVRVAALLRERGADVGDPQIVARTGWTTDELAEGIAAAAPRAPFDLVSLLIGVNNQYRGRDAESYRGEFRALLGQAAALAGGRGGGVVVVSIPDWGVTPFAEGRNRAQIASAINLLNAVAREEAAGAGALFGDITAISREPHDGWLADDGLHPSARQYERWAEELTPLFAAALGSPKA